jgi:cellulose synthase/poly-beta-1,6-N-acetylglucosamine synthase-like glycosyltransferase
LAFSVGRVHILALVVPALSILVTIELIDLLTMTIGTVGQSLGSEKAARGFEDVFKALGGFYLFGTLFPFLTFMGWKMLHQRRPKQNDFFPFVSVIIPAFNEEDSLTEAIEAAVRQDYPDYEVLIVNDGSNDRTKYIAELYGVRLIDLRQNRGKSRAVNIGSRQAHADILVFSDADSLLHKNALRYLVGHFEDPSVGAVAGRVSIVNGHQFLTRLQEIEYIFGQEIVKCAQRGSNSSVLVCPGPVCAFRREALEAIGGFSDRTLTEDFDATLSVIRAGYRVEYEPEAVAMTNAPTRWSQLKRQRLRWSRGMFQVFAENIELFFTRHAGMAGGFWMPYYLISAIGSIVFEMTLLLLLPFLLSSLANPLSALGTGLVFMLVIEVLVSIEYLVALVVAGQIRPGLLLAAIAMKPYNIFLSYIRLCALIAEMRGMRTQW